MLPSAPSTAPAAQIVWHGLVLPVRPCILLFYLGSGLAAFSMTFAADCIYLWTDGSTVGVLLLC